MAKAKKIKKTILTALILILSASIVFMSIYLVKLDREVRTKFAGARWALPAQVYASPLELFVGADLSLAETTGELSRLGYRRQSDVSGPGSYAVSGIQVEIQTRAFDFWDGAQPSMRLALNFSGRSIANIREEGGTGVRAIVRLDPQLIGSIHPAQGEDRVLVKLEEIPPLLPNGLVLIEDHRFYDHFGIDPIGITRAMVANIKAGRVVQGGSTLTQQLVRNFFLTLDQTFKRKINEAFMSVLLEAHYSKGAVLEAYLNEIFLGQDGDRAIHGFGLASHFYFQKPLTELRSHEIALLISLAKGASYYNPRRHPERAKQRRDFVLSKFRAAGYIDEEEYVAAVARDLGVKNKKNGVERYPAFIDLVKLQLKRDYKEQDLLTEGLRIFTTLDLRAQQALEDGITSRLPEIERNRKMAEDTLQAAGVVTSAEGGEVKALVGDRNVRFRGFNRALDSKRPIGSLAKPFVYLAALNEPDRYNLLTTVKDEPVSLKQAHGAIWEPKNYDKQLHGEIPLYLGLVKSYNLATVNVGLDVGINKITQIFNAAGYQPQIRPLPAIMLGALEMPPLDVAQIYSTLASGGYLYPLAAIREVTTSQGEPIARYPLKGRQALPEGPTYLLNWAMEQTMIFGTGASAYNQISPAIRLSGKTGTTDDYRDSWFAGYGGNQVAVIWVGRDDNKSTGLSGTSGALPIWSTVMKNLGVSSFDPLPPMNVINVLVDQQSGFKADAGCINPVSVPFIVEHAPRDFAPCARASQTSNPLDWFRDIFR